MATTSLWPYKNTVLRCITYVMNPDKTRTEWADLHLLEDGSQEFEEADRDEIAYLVSGINAVDVSSPQAAAEDFEFAKEINVFQNWRE